ncbi:rod shape-determining protein MreD [candidate division KSB3 bacterium]|uniref:Rod shape-determining protein MreD n=1 Tax=candidate division KSB3 bacterium TaxID=2044937 RepID=A0A2G6E6Z3_9BACT|nr:MAG: rod shape-determining protein MreD [candidate division KSB3 bacterium]PIE30285.1 MAG: rod shape-determining protein MreD [candidate division KSB3 bacterium]
MYFAFSLIVFLGAMIAQTTLLNFFTIHGVKPDLVLIIVVYLGLIEGPNPGCLSGFSFGLFEDVYSGISLSGVNALSKTISGFLGGLLGKHLYTQSFVVPVICVGLGTVLDVLLCVGLYQDFTPEWKRILVYESIYNMLCCPLIVMIFRFGERHLRRRTSL